MADSILRLKVESQEYDNKLKRAAEGLQRYVDGCRKAGGTLEFVEKETLEYVRALGQMGTSATTTRGKLAEMTKAFTEFSHEYNQLSDEEKKGEFGKALNASLGELRGRIQDSKKELDDINKSINGGGGLTGALDSFADKLGLNITQLTKFGSVASVATTALKVAKDAFFQSESNIDEWGRTVKGAEGAYNVFLDTLNNGNWSNFFDNLSKAIQGGRDLYDVFDRLGSIKSNNAAAIAIVQQQIAQLRLAKQQGENVDAQLKAATARLAELQKQSINAGKAAGTKSAFEVIRSGVNSVGGARINDATINYAIDRIMKNGQSEFDKYRYNRDLLQKRGTRTVVTSVDDGYGGTVNKYQNVFDINLLTKEQQKQYALAQAITEGETRIQKGIAAYAQAVQEGTSSAREEFKGNRYALQGKGGGGKGGTGKTTTAPTYAADSIAAQSALVSDLRKKWSEAGEAVRNDLLVQLIAAEDKLKSMNNQAALFRENQQGKLLGNTPDGNGIQTTGLGSISIAEQINEASKGLQGDALKAMQNLIKGGNDAQKSWANAASAIGSVGSALAGINDPAAKIMGIVAEAVANIALGFAKATAEDSKLGVFGWIAAIAGGLGTMMSTISAIHSATGYAEGGVIKGNSFSGDSLLAQGPDGGMIGLNAGEVVLNRAQAGVLASAIQENGGGNGRIAGVIRGEDIALVADRWGRRTGKGELAFFK
jgi:hypothetical protein